MHNRSNHFVTKMVIVTMIVFFGAVYITAPTDKDIAACRAQTGWSMERCQFELSR